MNVIFHRGFVKSYKKLRPIDQRKFKERKDVFLVNHFNPLLQNHPLHGKYAGYRSFNVTGDIRVVYRELDSKTVIFVEIGTHSELYE